MKMLLLVVISVLALCLPLLALAQDGDPTKYDVVWDSPSVDSSGSMPMGNGDIGVNFWVEKDGDLCIYISKTDAWTGAMDLVKVGAVRITLTPNPFINGQPFRQELHLADGSIVITAGKGMDAVSIRAWVDANQPVVRVEINGKQPLSLKAHVAMPWRKGDAYLPDQKGQVVWYWRNTTSCWAGDLTYQRLDSLIPQETDPLINRTFGAVMKGDGLSSISADTLQSAINAVPPAGYTLSVYPYTAQTATVDDWLTQMRDLVTRVDKTPLADAWTAHAKWWSDFWARSWIDVESPGGSMTPSTEPLRIGNSSNWPHGFRGGIASVRIYSRAMSPNEVIASAMSLEPPKNIPCVVDMSFPPYNGLSSTPADVLKVRAVCNVSLYTSPQVGPYLCFNGQGLCEAEDDPRLNFTTACTLEAWINPAATNDGAIIAKAQAGTTQGYSLDATPNNGLRFTTASGVLEYDNCLTPGAWAHVVATYDATAGEQRLYLNGALLKSAKILDGKGAAIVSQGYALQRFTDACGGRGAYPIKFNGSIFTYQREKTPQDNNFDDTIPDPDYRAWGGHYWLQNTRLIYWPLIASGDGDLLLPFFHMYRDCLPLAEARTQLYYGHDGAFFPETLAFWGTYRNGDYGGGRDDDPGYVSSGYMRYHWSGGIEVSAMMLDYWDDTQDTTFLKDTLLPVAGNVVEFNDKHYKRTPQGKLDISPAQSLETWQSAKNPLPEIAGLRDILPRLLKLPETTTTADQRAQWTRLLGELPDIPSQLTGQGKVLLPADYFTDKRNNENTELYAIFPYRIYGVGKPDLDIGLNSFAARRDPYVTCWGQDCTDEAYLGLAAGAAKDLITRFGQPAPGRFPAFWGPNSDWIPDEDHGGTGQCALQAMLMQTDGDKILLLPAWPAAWNVSFKLHAPKNTTVEGVFRDGKVQSLVVTPKEREKDVVVMGAQ